MNGPNRLAMVAGMLLLSTMTTPLGSPALAQQKVESIFRDARAYTVRVRTQITTPFIEDEQGSLSGAGFLVDAERGWILTNAHVAGKSPSTVQVAFADGHFMPVRKIYVDSFTDMAVLELPAEGRRHRVARINCEAPPEVGEGVGAYGHPLGMIFTGTRGIVSAMSDQQITDLVQIDATVDHGNSGGPVISLRDGRIVGIATAMMGGVKRDRVNFATPMKDVCRILSLLREGIPPDPPHMEFALLVDEAGRYTLEVGHVYNPSRWPFLPGDRILAVGREREPIVTAHGLVSALRGRRGSVPIRVERDGREIEVAATPAYRPAVLAARGINLDGILIAPIALQDSAVFREPPVLYVHSVDPGSAAEAQEFESYDIIETIDGRRFADLDALIEYARARPAGTAMRVVIRRQGGDLGWMDFHVRELPGEDVRVIGPESTLMSGRN